MKRTMAGYVNTILLVVLDGGLPDSVTAPTTEYAA